MKLAVSPVVRVHSMAVIGRLATRTATPCCRASRSLKPTRASGGGSSLHPQHVGSKNDLHRFTGENAPDFFGDVGVLATEELRPVLDNGHAAPEAVESWANSRPT